MSRVTDEELLDAIEAELRPQGRPHALYLELGIQYRSPLLGQVLTTRMLANLEERLIEVERRLGIGDGA